MRHPAPFLLVAAALAAAFLAPAAVAPAAHAKGTPTGMGIQPRIINGSATTEEGFASRWPWIVEVQLRTGSSTVGLCGGALVDSRTVLTAGHCATSSGSPARASDMQVVVGRRLASSATGDRIAVSVVTRHPSFHAQSLRNDIAVLRLQRAPVVQWQGIQPTSAADESWWGAGGGIAAGSDLVGPWVAGWGYTRPGQASSLPDALHEAKVPIGSDPACRSSFAPGHGTLADTSTMLCAGLPSSTPGGGVDTCQGDSGGPLIVGDGAGSWRLVGLTSWGRDCGGAYYGVYTRVGRYAPWIDSLRFEPAPTPPAPSSAPLADPPTSPGGGSTSSPGSGSGSGSGSDTGDGGTHAATGPTPATSAIGPLPIGDAAPATGNRRPTMPVRVRAFRPRRGMAVLTWRPSRDDVRVVGYRVLVYTRRGWRQKAYVRSTRIRLTRLQRGQRYIYRVQAVDSQRARSRTSAVVRVRPR